MIPTSLTFERLGIWAAAAAVLQILGLSVFIFGFFPVKPTLPGFSGPESYRFPSSTSPSPDVNITDLDAMQLRDLYRELSGLPPAYDRLILMVIDGLPAEFVLGRGHEPPSRYFVEAMPYTHSLLSSCKATAYHTKVAPPTVTMPRLKAMVSGAIGGFLDVAFNFNTQAFLDDNLLGQFYRIGWKLVMLGDETWIKLFPNLFARQDGVSSFYVKDIVEVDFNVTRHLEHELAAEDWNLLILHYLGLDHVGHIGGRQSTLMTPKLKEMDEVIQKIHTRTILNDRSSSRTLLVVVSDHGMTQGGNHGGSSYEETDALALFIGHGLESSFCSLGENNEAFQVDIAATLALLFGIPIPKNNVGVLIGKLFDSLPVDQRMRSFELNSWQLLRLLDIDFSATCYDGNSTSDLVNRCSENSIIDDSNKEKLCRLYFKARAAHKSWESRWCSNHSDDEDNYFVLAAESYYEFLRSASEWLSRKATDKPVVVLVLGTVLMAISCILFVLLVLSHARKADHLIQTKSGPLLSNHDGGPHLSFVILEVLIHVASLGSSSFVEEEQYTCHFLASSLYLTFLLSDARDLLNATDSYQQSSEKDAENKRCSAVSQKRGWLVTRDAYKLPCAIIVLICGRILRSWYQGGVNWVSLPDISKSLVDSGVSTVKMLQIASLVGIIAIHSVALSGLRSRSSLFLILRSSPLFSGLLVFLHIMETQIGSSSPINHTATMIAQIFYVVFCVSTTFTFLSVPWIFPVERNGSPEPLRLSRSSMSPAFDDATYLIGMTHATFWCLLQLLLQQPVNAIPIFLIYLQMMCSVVHFTGHGSSSKQLVEVAALLFLGMAGHFALGNTNTLATIDVAGAFIGISSHSTVFSGLLMFIITYASPMLSYLVITVYIATGDHHGTFERKLAFPCLLPLLMNSLLLTSFTGILLLMRNHLFIWSVFSPKYLYVCAATICMFAGVLAVAAVSAYTSAVSTFQNREPKK